MNDVDVFSSNVFVVLECLVVEMAKDLLLLPMLLKKI